jgi:hypothetical protein
LTAIAVGLGVACAVPVWRWGGSEALRSLGVGAGLSWFAVLASYIGLSLAFRAHRSPAVIVLGGFVVRLALLFALLGVVARLWVVNLSHVVLWLVGFYVVLVIAEAVFLTVPARRLGGVKRT